MIKWNKVTWYSQITAIILGVGIFGVGFYLGSLQYSTKVSVDRISFSGLDTDTRDLPPTPSDEEWKNELNNSIFKDRIEEDVRKYGDFIKRYYSDSEYNHFYIKITEADLTSDGITEKIVSFDGGGSFGIERYEIVQGERIIATIKTPSVGRGGALLPDVSGNGFSITWYREDMFPNGYCCPTAHMITRFVFEDEIFKPVYEQIIVKP